MVRKRFSEKEIKELIISVLIMSLAVAIATRSFYTFFIALVVVGPGFVFHELAHKLTAQEYGYWAEYAMWRQGLFLALLISITGFVFIAPGAVYFMDRGVHSAKGKEVIGRIGIAGPLVNIGLAGLFALLFIFGGPVLGSIGYFGVYINSWLAIFNLIPFPPLDGQKVFAWDKKVWLITLAVSVAIFLWIR